MLMLIYYYFQCIYLVLSGVKTKQKNHLKSGISFQELFGRQLFSDGHYVK